MSKFRIKGRDCCLDNEDLDDIRESTRSESKQKKQKKRYSNEQDFFSEYKHNKQKKNIDSSEINDSQSVRLLKVESDIVGFKNVRRTD